MQTVVIGMVKNETDIIETFVGHVMAMFDHVVLIDHASSDGTREYLQAVHNAQPGRLTLYYFDEPGYFQSELMTWAVRQVAAAESPDWVFILDADEFLPFEDKQAFRQALSEHAASPVIAMPWRNIAPAVFEAGGLQGRECLVAKENSRHVKVAFQPARLDLSTVIVSQGNHALQTADKRKRIKADKVFSLFHLPIRSRAQLTLKLLQGLVAHEKMGADRPEVFGYHWVEMVGYIRQHGITDELMQGLALRYGERIKDRVLAHHALGERDYDRESLRVGTAELPVAPPSCLEEHASLVVALAETLGRPSQAATLQAGWRLDLGEDGRIELIAGPGGLPRGRAKVSGWRSLKKRVKAFLSSSNRRR